METNKTKLSRRSKEILRALLQGEEVITDGRSRKALECLEKAGLIEVTKKRNYKLVNRRRTGATLYVPELIIKDEKKIDEIVNLYSKREVHLNVSEKEILRAIVHNIPTKKVNNNGYTHYKRHDKAIQKLKSKGIIYKDNENMLRVFDDKLGFVINRIEQGLDEALDELLREERIMYIIENNAVTFTRRGEVIFRTLLDNDYNLNHFKSIAFNLVMDYFDCDVRKLRSIRYANDL